MRVQFLPPAPCFLPSGRSFSRSSNDLDEYLRKAAERIIREQASGDSEEAEELEGSDAGASAMNPAGHDLDWPGEQR